MPVRTLVALALVAVTGHGLLAQQSDAAAKVGDLLVIRMTGDLAKQYARRTGSPQETEASAGLTIETTATIEQKLDGGRIRIEHRSHIVRDGHQARLVTLTAIVDSAKFTTDLTPRGTSIYASPADHKNGAHPRTTTEDTKTLRLELSELKGLKLRTWTLAEEVGN